MDHKKNVTNSPIPDDQDPIGRIEIANPAGLRRIAAGDLEEIQALLYKSASDPLDRNWPLEGDGWNC